MLNEKKNKKMLLCEKKGMDGGASVGKGVE
jgi:hypothetical protein